MNFTRRHFALLVATSLFAGNVQAADPVTITVVSSGGFAAAVKPLAADFTKKTGIAVNLQWGASMGKTDTAVPQRLDRKEAIDAVVMVGYALDDLVKAGKLSADDKKLLANSSIGAAVKAGAPHPAIATADDLKKALLEAPSIAVSDSASGVYIRGEMLAKLGIADQMKDKVKTIPGTPVGESIAKGEAALGFQQISELKPVDGIDLLGPIAKDVQSVTVYSGTTVAGSAHAAEAKQFIQFLASPEAKAAIAATGLDPL